MFDGEQLGAAIQAAMDRKGVNQTVLAKEFGVQQPSVSNWVRTGRIAKEHLDHLFAYFSDVAGLSHWGFKKFVSVYDKAYAEALEINESLKSQDGAPSREALELAIRIDALGGRQRQVVLATAGELLLQFESQKRK